MWSPLSLCALVGRLVVLLVLFYYQIMFKHVKLKAKFQRNMYHYFLQSQSCYPFAGNGVFEKENYFRHFLWNRVCSNCTALCILLPFLYDVPTCTWCKLSYLKSSYLRGLVHLTVTVPATKCFILFTTPTSHFCPNSSLDQLDKVLICVLLYTCSIWPVYSLARPAVPAVQLLSFC